MQVDFYHLTRSPLDKVLPRIAERIVGQGGRLMIVAQDAEARQAIDQFLWTYSPASFLPHAQAGNLDDAAQPVLIGDAPVPSNGARNIAIVDGIWRDEALAFDRVFHVFGEDMIAPARTTWKALANRDGVEPRYWKQTDSGWEQAA